MVAKLSADAPGGPTALAQAQAQQVAAHFAHLQQVQAQASNPWAYGGFHPMMPFMNPYMWQTAQAQAAAAATAATTTPGKYQGRIKSFNAEKGFGFIECQQTFAQYSRDVFLHKAQIGDLQPGAMVSSSCEVNKQGMPQ